MAPNRLTLPLGLPCLLFATLLGSAAATSSPGAGYMAVAPMVFRPGVEEVISITMFNVSSPVHVEATVHINRASVASAAETITGKGSLRLKVPHDAKGKATLKVCGNCAQAARVGEREVFFFHNSTSVIIEERGSAVFIQTDKPVYKPGQTAFINVITTTPNLRPLDAGMEAYITDPRGSKMMQWRDLKPVCCGVVNMSFPISDQPILGDWTIFVEVQGQTYNKTFSIQKYVLPKFEVIIVPPKYIVDLDRCEQVNITARYTFGQPVQGKLTVSTTIHGIGYYKDEIGPTVLNSMDIDDTASFNVCANAMGVSALSDHFRGVLVVEATVTTGDGGTQTAVDDSTPVNKQLIDIEFSPDTRRHFKPGLPYIGKVLVSYPDGSPANNITVQVKADVNRAFFYTKEFMSSEGMIIFDIPALPNIAQNVWLDAKVLAIQGREVGESYFSSYLSISNWYSPSKCHIQVQNPPKKVKVGKKAVLTVLSTCPCDFTLHYEVVSRGNIVQSGLHRALPDHVIIRRDAEENPESLEQHDAAASEEREGWKEDKKERRQERKRGHRRKHPKDLVEELQVKVERTMDEDGEEEGRDDDDNRTRILEEGVIKFINGTNRQDTSTDPPMEMPEVCETRIQVLVTHAMAPLSRVVVYYIRPNGEGVADSMQLEVEPEFESKVVLSLPYNETLPGDRVDIAVKSKPGSCVCMASVDKSVYLLRPGFQLTKETIFKELETFDVTHGETEERFWWGYSARRKRSSLWLNFIHSRDAMYAFMETGLQVMTDVVSLNHRQDPNNWIQSEMMQSVSSFTMSVFHDGVPKAEKRKRVFFPETWIWQCFNVSSTRKHETVTMTAPDTITSWVTEAFSMSETHGLSLAAPVTLRTYKPFFIDFTLPYSVVRGEQVKIPLSIHNYLEYCTEAEGTEKSYTHSVYFCPNERIHISTPNKYEYQYVKKPTETTIFTFATKASNDVHLSLSARPTDMPSMYEIVIGGWQNTQSWITRSKQGDHLVTVPTPEILSWHEFRAFWLSWTDGVIEVGYGIEPTNDSLIMTWVDPEPLPVKYIGFSTGWGSLGEFKIWRREDTDGTYSEVFHLGLPHNTIPGSERAHATMIGDVMGPTLTNLHDLLKLPFGCGEQNMIHFAPNVFVMKYLERTGQLSWEVEDEATTYLIKGYQRQLTYRRKDGSYSAFGNRDSQGSMWLTSFVLKSFSQARSFIYIDPAELEKPREWIISQQAPDGSFPPLGQLINKDLQGGLQGRVSLTAYVVTTLLEMGISSKEVNKAINYARKFLEDNVHTVEDPYTAALVAYALTALRSTHGPTAVKKLNTMAIKTDSFTHWSLYGGQEETEKILQFKDGLGQSVSSAEVEMTAYALLTYVAMGDVASAMPVVKWLSQQRNSLGGFSSTQDTCVALQSLSEYAILAYIGGVNLNISLASTNLDFNKFFSLDSENHEVLQTAEIPSIPTRLFVSATGEGCGLMQIDVTYNIPDPSAQPTFHLDIKTSEKLRHNGRASQGRSKRSENDVSNVITNPGDYKVTIEACARWLPPGASNMAVLEVSLLTGFEADIESLEKLLHDQQMTVKRYEVDGRKVFFYFDEIPSQCLTCVSFEAFRIFVVGKVQPMPVRVYDYYEPSFEAVTFYNISQSQLLQSALCEDEAECNQVNLDDLEATEEKVLDFPSLECNSVFGCPSEDIPRCTCYRDCQSTGPQVCGSNGVLYPNRCSMEVSACQNHTHLQAIPLEECVTYSTEEPSVDPTEGSGDNGSEIFVQGNSSSTHFGEQTHDEDVVMATVSADNLDFPTLPVVEEDATWQPDIEGKMLNPDYWQPAPGYSYYDTYGDPFSTDQDVDIPDFTMEGKILYASVEEEERSELSEEKTAVDHDSAEALIKEQDKEEGSSQNGNSSRIISKEGEIEGAMENPGTKSDLHDKEEETERESRGRASDEMSEIEDLWVDRLDLDWRTDEESVISGPEEEEEDAAQGNTGEDEGIASLQEEIQKFKEEQKEAETKPHKHRHGKGEDRGKHKQSGQNKKNQSFESQEKIDDLDSVWLKFVQDEVMDDRDLSDERDEQGMIQKNTSADDKDDKEYKGWEFEARDEAETDTRKVNNAEKEVKESESEESLDSDENTQEETTNDQEPLREERTDTAESEKDLLEIPVDEDMNEREDELASYLEDEESSMREGTIDWDDFSEFVSHPIKEKEKDVTVDEEDSLEWDKFSKFISGLAGDTENVTTKGEGMEMRDDHNNNNNNEEEIGEEFQEEFLEIMEGLGTESTKYETHTTTATQMPHSKFEPKTEQSTVQDALSNSHDVTLPTTQQPVHESEPVSTEPDRQPDSSQDKDQR
ncbi:C3 and PZP-like alpha-2-macroglobulin domain-containing protein 8 [Branchiostoma lanceolatum]|uniref:C3 and PZP-like alpha-2-macroglobulin domain-containing protein 8 n=1 Tax=Branchiostoma lanceolatum TaxID=7740 RepID=UPI0034556B7F